MYINTTYSLSIFATITYRASKTWKSLKEDNITTSHPAFIWNPKRYILLHSESPYFNLSTTLGKISVYRSCIKYLYKIFLFLYSDVQSLWKSSFHIIYSPVYQSFQECQVNRGFPKSNNSTQNEGEVSWSFLKYDPTHTCIWSQALGALMD